MTVATFSCIQDLTLFNEYTQKDSELEHIASRNPLPWWIGVILRREKEITDFSSTFSIDVGNRPLILEEFITTRSFPEKDFELLYDHFSGKPKSISMYTGKVIYKGKAKGNISLDEEY